MPNIMTLEDKVSKALCDCGARDPFYSDEMARAAIRVVVLEAIKALPDSDTACGLDALQMWRACYLAVAALAPDEPPAPAALTMPLPPPTHTKGKT